MLKILKCRRSSLALIAMCMLTYLGVRNGTDVSLSIATIVGAVGAANAWEKRGTKNED